MEGGDDWAEEPGKRLRPGRNSRPEARSDEASGGISAGVARFAGPAQRCPVGQRGQSGPCC